MAIKKKFILLATAAAAIAVLAIGIVFFMASGKKPASQNQTAPLTAETKNTPPQAEQNAPEDKQNDAKENESVNDKTDAVESAQNPGDLVDKITEAAANPVENKPDINPTSGTNPLRKVKTNPFE